jgi:uncharacterized protein
VTETEEESPAAELGAPAGPITGAERISAIDSLRGFAVLGILVMNIYGFAMPFAAYNNPLLMGGTEWYNLGTWFLTHIVFDQKFMTIFSLLFGGGLVIMWERATARGARFTPIYFRRQGWLLVIGALHGYLLWFGDILFHYALVGMFTFFFRKRQARTLIVIALLMLPVAPLMQAAGSVYFEGLKAEVTEISRLEASGVSLSEEQQAKVAEWNEMAAFMAPTEETVREDVEAYLGGYPDIVAYRAPMVATMQINSTLFYILWRVGGLMLLGMALMKLGILSGRRDIGFYRKMMLAGYGLGFPVMLYSAWTLNAHQWDGMYMFRIGMLPNYVGSVLVAFGHIAMVMLVVKSGVLSGLVARFTAVGRMALTNYLMHTVVMTTIFYGYGLGLYGEIPRAAQMLFVAGMISFQLWLSPVWLRAYRFGPVEWLWRSLTYWRRQPMRISA